MGFEKPIALILYYSKNNIYSFNALIGALESDEIASDIDIFFISEKNELSKSIEKAISRYKKVILAISFFTTQLWEINNLIKPLKKHFKQKLIFIAGGPHPTGDALGTLKIGFDVVVRGEGEETFIELVHKIKDDESYSEIKGIGFVNEKKEHVFTDRRNKIDLNKYPPFPFFNKRFGAIEITRGCPYACYFCQTPQLLGTRPRHRSIESICKYVEIMKEENLTDIRFITPNAFSYGSINGKNLNLSKLEELLLNVKEIIKPEGRIFLGSFPSEVRPEHVTEESLALILKYADNDNIIIGAQSGSQKVLDACNRAHTIEDIYRSVTLTINSGLKAYVDFIFGLPNENEDDIMMTINVMKDLTNLGARIHTHSFIPLPMTTFAKSPVKKMDKNLLKTIDSLTAAGRAFGSWKKQEKIAEKISKYLITKDLE